MKERIKEMFDLEFIRRFAEDNINDSDWTEEDYGETENPGIETLVHGGTVLIFPEWSWNCLDRRTGTI